VPDLSVVLVGLNAREYVKGCLESIASAEWRSVSHEVLYVDNGSTDGSASMVRDRFPETIVIANPTNLGFCRAANQGARQARGRYLYFINDDTVVLGDALARLVEYMDRAPLAGTVGSRLLYPDGTEQWSGRRFPTLMNGLFGRRSLLGRLFPRAGWVREYLCKDELGGDEPFEVDWVSAAGQIVRPETFAAVGGYAEDYYYWHEAVFCDRVRAAGMRVLLHPRSRVIHYEGKGSGARPYRVQRFHILDFHRGAFRFYCSHHRLEPWHPLRWLAAAALGTRAAILLTASRIRTFSLPAAWAGGGRRSHGD
jgi:hypothetical protein